MKRLPRGGKKVNYTVYIPSELREEMKKRALSLDMSESYYLSVLVETDLKADIVSHVEKSESQEISIAPGKDITSDELEEFSDNLKTNVSEPGEIKLPEEKPVVQNTAPPAIQRPVMKTIADLQREQSGTLASTNMRNPGRPPTAQRAASALNTNWEQKIHADLSADQRSDAAMRRRILDNLPEKEESEE